MREIALIAVLASGCQNPRQAVATQQIVRAAETRLAATGFESGIALEGPFDSGNHRLWQARLTGSDVNGFSWPTRVWNARSEYFFMLADRPVDDLSAVMTTRLTTVAGYNGAPTRALYMEVLEGERDAQNDYYIAEVEERPSMYLRYRIMLDERIAAAAKHRDFWRGVFTLKTAGDFRIAAGIYPDAGGNPFWFVHADNNANGDLPPAGSYEELWTCSERSVPVKSAAWMLFEIYWEREATGDGVFYWAIDGEVVAAYCGPLHGAQGAQINRIMPFMVYAARPGLPAAQWIDDFEAADLPPCAPLPCREQRESPSSRQAVRRAICETAASRFADRCTRAPAR